MMALVVLIDSDNDGYLSVEESLSFLELLWIKEGTPQPHWFEEMDSNEDRLISPHEFDKHLPRGRSLFAHLSELF